MRFTYAESMIDPTFYVPLARAAEDAGYDGFLIPDSIAYPKESDSTYPFTADGNREFLDDKPFLDPFSLISALGVSTERIEFIVSVLKLPIRHPVLLAKQAASAAVLSGNRMRLGVGVSPWPDDYELLGIPWAGRGRRMDECIAILTGLLDGGYYEHHGEFFDFEPVKMSPSPSERVPILVGGHSDAALRRAARLDGWIHGGGGDADELPRLLRRLAEIREEEGRAEASFGVHVISMDAYTVDGLHELESLGVTDVMVGFRWPYVTGPDTESLDHKVDQLQRYASRVISEFR